MTKARCPHCGMNHPGNFHTEKYELKDRIPDKGFPTSSKRYPESHEKADKEEKKKYPNGYNSLKSLVKKTPHGELLGKSTRTGRVEVSDKVPRKLREEVAFHEKTENKDLLKGKKK